MIKKWLDPISEIWVNKNILSRFFMLSLAGILSLSLVACDDDSDDDDDDGGERTPPGMTPPTMTPPTIKIEGIAISSSAISFQATYSEGGTMSASHNDRTQVSFQTTPPEVVGIYCVGIEEGVDDGMLTAENIKNGKRSDASTDADAKIDGGAPILVDVATALSMSGTLDISKEYDISCVVEKDNTFSGLATVSSSEVVKNTRILSYTEDGITSTYTYDGEGRLDRLTRRDADGARTATNIYFYNGSGDQEVQSAEESYISPTAIPAKLKVYGPVENGDDDQSEGHVQVEIDYVDDDGVIQSEAQEVELTETYYKKLPPTVVIITARIQYEVKDANLVDFNGYDKDQAVDISTIDDMLKANPAADDANNKVTLKAIDLYEYAEGNFGNQVLLRTNYRGTINNSEDTPVPLSLDKETIAALRTAIKEEDGEIGNSASLADARKPALDNGDKLYRYFYNAERQLFRIERHGVDIAALDKSSGMERIETWTYSDGLISTRERDTNADGTSDDKREHSYERSQVKTKYALLRWKSIIDHLIRFFFKPL